MLWKNERGGGKRVTRRPGAGKGKDRAMQADGHPLLEIPVVTAVPSSGKQDQISIVRRDYPQFDNMKHQKNSYFIEVVKT
jgi:hypothetical protein